MNTQEITNGNKLIAEFMEYPGDGNGLYFTPFSDSEELVCASELPYHSSWDWLMPVVEKIEGENEVDELTIKYCDVFGNSVQILPSFDNSFKPIFMCGGYEKIELTFFACIEFIKWYNENKN